MTSLFILFLGLSSSMAMYDQTLAKDQALSPRQSSVPSNIDTNLNSQYRSNAALPWNPSSRLDLSVIFPRSKIPHNEDSINKNHNDRENLRRITPLVKNSEDSSNNQCNNIENNVKNNLLLAMTLDLKKMIDDLMMESNKFQNRNSDVWRIREPLYVEEPSLIEFDSDYSTDNWGDGTGNDPFFVSRGKKYQTKRTNYNNQDKDGEATKKVLWKKTNKDYLENLRQHLDNDDPYFLSRGKRQLIELANFTKILTRNKRDSNVMDLLQEPYFITRGKKFLLDSRGSLSSDNTKSAGNGFYSKRNDNVNNDGQQDRLRNRREQLEELLIKEDPYYIIRGKKIPINYSDNNVLDDFFVKYDPYYIGRGKKK